MNKVIVVGNRDNNNAESLSSDVIIIPEVYYPEGRGSIGPKKRGIEHAMWNAVQIAGPGDLIIQDDITVNVDPFAAPIAIGFIRTFAEPWDTNHYCPRAFMFYNVRVKDDLLAAWNPERPDIPHDEYACTAWKLVPKREDVLGVTHG